MLDVVVMSALVFFCGGVLLVSVLKMILDIINSYRED